MSSGISPAGAVPPGLGGCGIARLGTHCQRLNGVPLELCTRILRVSYHIVIQSGYPFAPGSYLIVLTVDGHEYKQALHVEEEK